MSGRMKDIDLGFDLISDPIFPTGYTGDITPATQPRERNGFPWHSLMWSRGDHHWHPVTDRDTMRILLAGTRNGDILFVTRQPGYGEPVVRVAGYADHDAPAVEVVTADDATYQVARVPAPVHLEQVDKAPVGAQRKGEVRDAVVYGHPAFVWTPTLKPWRSSARGPAVSSHQTGTSLSPGLRTTLLLHSTLTNSGCDLWKRSNVTADGVVKGIEYIWKKNPPSPPPMAPHCSRPNRLQLTWASVKAPSPTGVPLGCPRPVQCRSGGRYGTAP